jgi:hypothetical protein
LHGYDTRRSCNCGQLWKNSLHRKVAHATSRVLDNGRDINQMTSRERLIGARKLVSCVETPIDGSAPSHPMGEAPPGIIMYTPGGYISAELGTRLICLLIPALLCLSGCNDIGLQHRAADSGMEKLRTLLNDGHCDTIYQTADMLFRRNQSLDRWRSACLGLRTRLGTFSSFTPESRNAYPLSDVGIVWVSGKGQFTAGPKTIRSDWNIAPDGPHLVSIYLEDGAERLSIPSGP